MFENRLQESVALRVTDGVFADGQAGYTDYQAYALITDFTSRDINHYGSIKNGKIFLLRCDYEPKPGSQLIHNEQTYDLKDIKICKDIDGNIECYRCVVV